MFVELMTLGAFLVVCTLVFIMGDMLLGGWMVVHGSLSVGDFFRFNLFVTMLILPLRMLGMWIGQAQRATASGERIFEVLDEEVDIDDRPDAPELPAGPGRIRFEPRC